MKHTPACSRRKGKVCGETLRRKAKRFQGDRFQNDVERFALRRVRPDGGCNLTRRSDKTQVTPEVTGESKRIDRGSAWRSATRWFGRHGNQPVVAGPTMRADDGRLCLVSKAAARKRRRGSTSKVRIGNNRDQAPGRRTVRVKPSEEVRQRRIGIITVRERSNKQAASGDASQHLSSVDETGDLVDRRRRRRSSRSNANPAARSASTRIEGDVSARGVGRAIGLKTDAEVQRFPQMTS